MLGQHASENLLKRALRLSKADEMQVLVSAHESYLTRFANNVIHQNVAEANVGVTIRAVMGKRSGTATTNRTDDEALAQAAERAVLHARRQPEDPDFPGLPDPRPIEPAHAFDEDTASLTPEARARSVGVVCDLAAEHGMGASGAFRTTAGELAVGNSHGIMAYHAGTTADLQTVVTGQDGTGQAQASSWKSRDIDAEAIGREAAGKAVRAQYPHAIQPGDYTVVLDPYATEGLVAMLNTTGMSAQAVQEGRSWMNDRMGQQIMSQIVSIWDDGHDPEGSPLPFDFEGVPRQLVQIVDRGVVRDPVYDRYTAKKEGRESTGHATPPTMRFVSGPLAMNLFMAAGDSSAEEMIRSTAKGLYVTRFWYTRPVHPRDCIVTGMTRDGLFMIENGELTHAVKNLRFTQSYVKAMGEVQAVSRERRTLITEFGGAYCVPALKIEAFNFTGSTV